MQEFKKTLALIFLTIAIMVPALGSQLSYAQFIPCRIVNLTVTPSNVVQVGQSFQVTSSLTVSCDPSVLPVVRVDLIDPETSKTLSTTSLPYYSYSSSFTVSVVNQATARQVVGSWMLQVQAYVINDVNGQSAASSSQSFAVNVEPYTPPVTEMQTETTVQTSITSSYSSTISASSTITNQNLTETSLPSQAISNNEAAPNEIGELLLPVAIVLVGFAVFSLLMFAAHRKSPRLVPATKYCGQCGGALEHNENYCTTCGARQRK